MTAALRRDIAVLAVQMNRPDRTPVCPPLELPSQYFFLLQRIEALAANWREGHVAVVFDEEGRKRDLHRGFAFTKLVQGYWDGKYFARIIGVPLFGNSAANVGLELADMLAYAVFMEKFGSARPSIPLADEYVEAIKELTDSIYAKCPYTFDYHNRNEYYGIYRMPEKYFYSRVAQA